MRLVVFDHAVRVAKAIAAVDRDVPGEAESLWPTLTVQDQARYVTMAKEAVLAYLAAVGDSRTE